jgi:hypothetical protein
MSPSDGSYKARHGLTCAKVHALVVAVLPALLLASFDLTSFAQSEPPKVAQKPAVTREKLFPNNRGAQRMTNVAGEERTLAWMIVDQMPDWAEWWATSEIMVGLGMPEERIAAVEAMLEVRKQARVAAISASENSEAGMRYAEAARAAGVGSTPPLEVRAELVRLASRAASQAFDAMKEADRAFANSCALLVVPETQPESKPDETTLERMRLGVQRLRGFDPALSRMKLLNTGVELTIHAAPLLEQASESRKAIADEITAWQQTVAPLLEAFDRQRSEFAAANAADQPLDQRLRRRAAAGELRRVIHADLVAATVRSARSIAAIIAGSDPDRANAWLRSVYQSLSPMSLGETAGEAALEEAMRMAAAFGEEGEEWSAALEAIRVETLRDCAQLEGLLIDACVGAIRNRDKMVEVGVRSGPVFAVNERRFEQSDAALRRLNGVVPAAFRDDLDRAFHSVRTRTSQHFPRP